MEKEKLRESQEKLRDAAEFIPNPIVPSSVELDSEIGGNFKPQPNDVDTDLYEKHTVILSEWDQDTVALMALRSDGGGGSDDDEKGGLDSDKLIDQFFESKSIVKRQLERINKVTTNEHLLELMEHQQLIEHQQSVLNIYCVSPRTFLYALWVSVQPSSVPSKWC